MTAVERPMGGVQRMTYTHVEATVTREQQIRAASRVWEWAGCDPELTRQVVAVLCGPCNETVYDITSRKTVLRPAGGGK